MTVLDRPRLARPSLDELTEIVAPVSVGSERCEAIAGLLTLPEGGPVLVEGHHRLILRALHAPDRVELVTLLPKGNGKTVIFGAAAIDHLLTTQNANAYIGAADVPQADEMLRFVEHFAAECDPEIAEQFLVRDATKTVRCVRDRGFVKILASDSSRAGAKRQALNPTLFLVDELHAHVNSNLYIAGRSGVFKRGGRIASLSTAGHDRESTLGELLDRLLSIEAEGGLVYRDLHVTDDGRLSDEGPGRLTVAVSASRGTVLLMWACRGDDDPMGADNLEDDGLVKLANPASFVTVAGIRDGREGLTPWDFARYRANVWTQGHQSWLPGGAWLKLQDGPGAPGLTDKDPTVVAVDMGRYQDSAAVTAVQRSDTDPWLAEPLLIKRSGGRDKPIPYAVVKQVIRDACKAHNVVAVPYDPKYFDQAAEELSGEGIPMLPFPQSNERMGVACPSLRRAILAEEQQLRFRGPSDCVFANEFTRQVVAGETKELGESMFKIVKPSKMVLIDAGVSLAMAWVTAEAFVPQDPSIPIFEIV